MHYEFTISSEGQRAQVSSTDEFTDPMVKHCLRMRERYPDLPLYIMGHSMGGLLAVLADSAHPDLFDGVVLLNPLFRYSPNQATPVTNLLIKLLVQTQPDLQLPTPEFSVNISSVTSDPFWQEVMQADPLYYKGGLNVMLASVLTAAMESLKYEETTTPFLLILSDQDRIVDTAVSRKFHEEAGSVDKQMNAFLKGLHQLYVENEDIEEQAISLSLDWIQERIDFKVSEI